MQAIARRFNDGWPAEGHMLLRIGIHAGEVAIADFDDIGAVVDLAQRLMTLAQPGEIIVSDDVRALLVPGLDADIEDLGECHLKHVDMPVRAWRLGPVADRSGLARVSERRNAALRPVIAVLPFGCRVGFDAGDALGMALAEEVIIKLSRLAEFDVINGESTHQLRGRDLAPRDLGQRLDADLMLRGGYRLHPDGFVLNLTLEDLRRDRVVLSEQYESSAHEAFDGPDPLAQRIVQDVCKGVFKHAIALTSAAPLLAVEGYALLFAAIGLMHRATARHFDRAREMLLHLVGRQGRYGIAEAWLAKWHVLRVVQGWASDPDAERRDALDHVARSLDLNPSNALALTIGGLVHAYLSKDLAVAGRMYQAALDDNPCEPLAWLFSATRHAWLGEGSEASAASTMALRLTPLDPLRYFYESLAATAVAGNAEWDSAVRLARQSIKSNRAHASTWRTLVYALTMLGQGQEARQAAGELMRIAPGLTVARFGERFPGRDGPMAAPLADALRDAGVPD
jgi:TolB-like protein